MFGIHIRKAIQAKKKTVDYIETHEIKNCKTMTSAVKDFKKDFPDAGMIQIYAHGPMNTRRNKINVETFNTESKNLNVYIHSTHMTSWKEDGEVKFDKKGNPKISKSEHIREQFETAGELNAKGIVIHLPKASPEFVCEKLPEWVDWIPDGTKLLLEVRSIRPSENLSYETAEKLINLIEMIKTVDGYTSDNCGIVLDTAHIYVSYTPVKGYDESIDFLNKLEDYREWFPLLHFNGNYIDANKKAGDTHITPFCAGDKIWGDEDTLLADRLESSWETSGAKAYVEKFLEWKSDIVLEIDHHAKSSRDFLQFLLDQL